MCTSFSSIWHQRLMQTKRRAFVSHYYLYLSEHYYCHLPSTEARRMRARFKQALCIALMMMLTLGYLYLLFSQRIPGAFIHLSYIVFAFVFTMIVCYHNRSNVDETSERPHTSSAHMPFTLPDSASFPPRIYEPSTYMYPPQTLPRYSPPVFSAYGNDTTLLMPPPYKPER